MDERKKIQARYYWKYVLNLDEAEKDLKSLLLPKLSTAQSQLF